MLVVVGWVWPGLIGSDDDVAGDDDDDADDAEGSDECICARYSSR